MPAPWWIEVLNLAAEWGIPPWEIVHDRGKALWILRHRIWSRTIDTAQRDKAKH